VRAYADCDDREKVTPDPSLAAKRAKCHEESAQGKKRPNVLRKEAKYLREHGLPRPHGGGPPPPRQPQSPSSTPLPSPQTTQSRPPTAGGTASGRSGSTRGPARPINWRQRVKERDEQLRELEADIELRVASHEEREREWRAERAAMARRLARLEAALKAAGTILADDKEEETDGADE
jgi:hypothetical protein